MAIIRLVGNSIGGIHGGKKQRQPDLDEWRITTVCPHLIMKIRFRFGHSSTKIRGLRVRMHTHNSLIHSIRVFPPLKRQEREAVTAALLCLRSTPFLLLSDYINIEYRALSLSCHFSRGIADVQMKDNKTLLSNILLAALYNPLPCQSIWADEIFELQTLRSFGSVLVPEILHRIFLCLSFCRGFLFVCLWMEHWEGNGSYCSDGELCSNVSIMQSFCGDAYDSWRPTSQKIDYQCYLGEDVAIRQYCAAARLERQESYDEMDTGLLSISDSSDSPLDMAEEDEMIESFINMDDGEHESSEFDDDSKSRESEDKVSRFKDERFPKVLQDVVEIGASNRERTVKPGGSGEIDQGLQLVHLLLACAEAVGCRDSQLAAKVLQQIWKSAHPSGDALQRVTCCFAKGLTTRLLLLLQNNNNSNNSNNISAKSLRSLQPPGSSDLMRAPTIAERAEGFQLLYQCTPYVAFGFMAANEAIAQAAEGKKIIHIVDLGMVQALQWPALMRKLAASAEGAPTLRLTGMANCSYSEIQEWGAALGSEAKTLGLGFEFRGIVEPVSPNLLDPVFLNLRPGETLIINSVLCLHKLVNESRGSLRSIMQALQKLNPCILTLVEQDANHNGPFFLGRFLESLHYYSVIFDSLEASLPRSSPQRMKVERFHFAEEIGNIVAYEAAERVERHERADQWRRQLGRSGFVGFPLRFMSQARMMLSVYGCDGYTLAEDKGSLLLGWKGRPIMLASAWRPNNHSHS